MKVARAVFPELPMLLASCAAALACACGASNATVPPPDDAALIEGAGPSTRADAGTTDIATAAPSPSAPPLSPKPLARSRVHAVLERGLGAFLQRVTLAERPVFVGNKFRGFRIVELRADPSFWRGVDLSPGDVVTRVNGFPLERPEQALEAFRSLDVASELRVDYDRDGAPRTLRYAIVDDAPVARRP